MEVNAFQCAHEPSWMNIKFLSLSMHSTHEELQVNMTPFKDDTWTKIYIYIFVGVMLSVTGHVQNFQKVILSEPLC